MIELFLITLHSGDVPRNFTLTITRSCVFSILSVELVFEPTALWPDDLMAKASTVQSFRDKFASCTCVHRKAQLKRGTYIC